MLHNLQEIQEEIEEKKDTPKFVGGPKRYSIAAPTGRLSIKRNPVEAPDEATCETEDPNTLPFDDEFQDDDGEE